jgi:hypothetical protein
MDRPLGRLAVLAALVLTASLTEAGSLALHGFAAGHSVEDSGPNSWLLGDFGRTSNAADGDFEVQAALDWEPGARWLVHAHGLLRRENPQAGGRRFGLPEAYLQFRPELSARTALRFRAGLLFPPTSLENVGRAWSSPYTMTLSSLNTWVAEEVRLTGVEGALLLGGQGRSELQLAGTIFGGNDSQGALIAWRGWTYGRRITTLGEVLPLPPLPTLGAGGSFSGQRADGTKPIGELDGRRGRQLRARFSRPNGLKLQVAHTDSRGDRELHHGQYSWDTRFLQLGGELPLWRGAAFIGELARGDTAMGDPRAAHVDVHFVSRYLMFTWGGKKARFSARYDSFRNQDRDRTAEPNQEDGRSWTLALFWLPQEWSRFGAEVVDIRSLRPAAAFSGFDPDTDTRAFTLEFRFFF